MKDEKNKVRENGQEPLELLHKIDAVISEKFGTRVVEPVAESIPFELHLPEITESGNPKYLSEKQLSFYLKGEADTSLQHLLPLHAAAYRKVKHLRYDFPLILNANGKMTPLRVWIDTLIESGDNDTAFLKTEALKLENYIKNDLDDATETAFIPLLDKALQKIQDDSAAQNGSMAVFEKTLSRARQSLCEQDMIISYDSDVYSVVSRFLVQNQIREALEKTVPDLAYRHASIKALIDSGETSPQKTGKSDWDTDIDFDKLNAISAALPRNDISSERMQRLKNIFATLDKWLPLQQDAVCQKLAADLWVTSVDDAKKQAAKRRQDAASFIKAYHMAGLEMANTYNPEHHDTFFNDFNISYLNDDERRLIFPVVLNIATNTPESIADMLVVFNGDDAIKIWAHEKAPLSNRDKTGIKPGIFSALSRMALAHTQVAVYQTALSFLPAQQEALRSAFAYDGPALLTIYDARDQKDASLPAWLLSGMAPEARVFANFSYNPAGDNDAGERFNLDQTPHAQTEWPMRSVDNGVIGEELPFTAVDFCAVLPEFAHHFKVVDPAEYHDKQIAFHTFIGDRQFHQQGYVPYILMADKESGLITRVLIDRALTEAAYRVLESWRMLQEMAGINNAHLEKQKTSLRNEWETEKEQALQALRDEYEAKLRQDRESLTDEIISNIAAGLLASDIVQMGGTRTSAAPAAAPVAKPAAEPEKEETVAETVAEDDDDMNFDTAYIDTPLCTSCNECRNQNDQLFLYDDNKQAYIGDVSKGTFKDLVTAAENCPVHIIHPGKPQNPDEPDLDDLMERAQKFN